MRRAVVGTTLAVAMSVALAACAPPAAEPTAWQQSVQTVARQASAGDYTSALSTLDALESEVVARRDAGGISAEEADAILARIATVRTDLSGSTPTPTPTPEPTQTTQPAPDDQQDVVDDGGGDSNEGGGGPGQGPADGKPGNDKGPGNGKGPGKKDG